MSEKVNIKLYEPTQPQIDALHVMYGDNPPLFTLLAYGRQTGKTYMAILDAITYALNNPETDILFISPTYENNGRIMDVVDKVFINNRPVKELVFKKIKYKEQEYEFFNGSRVDMRSAEQGDTLRGRTQHRIYIDEMAFMKRSFIFKVVVPMVTRTGGRIIGTSTFNGRNWWYKLYQRGQDEENKETVVSLLRTYLDLNDPEVEKVVMSLKSEMTKEEFAQEVMCRPISKDTLFLDVEDCIGYVDSEDNTPVCIGIDVGISNDYTVVTVIDTKYRVIEIDRFNVREDHLSPKEFKDRIMKLYYKYFDRLIAAYFEANNNELLLEELEDEYKDSYKLLGFLTTPTSKPKIINFLIKLFEEADILIPDFDVLLEELYGFKSKKNAITGKLQYTNIGVDHDDTVMSLAIACECVREESYSGVIQFM